MYVINDEEMLIYKVRIDKNDIVDRGDTSSYMEVKLDLVCGKDWVDVNDYGGTMGWVAPEHFIDEVQYESVICYFYTESIMAALTANGYQEIKKLPNIESIRESKKPTRKSLKERTFSTMTVVKRAFPQINLDAAKIIARWYDTEGFDPSEWGTLQEAVDYIYNDIFEMLDAADADEDKEIVVDGLIDCGRLDESDRDIYIPVESTLEFKVYLLNPDMNPREGVKYIKEEDCIYTICSKDADTPEKACTKACDFSVKYGNKHPSKRAVIVRILPDGDMGNLDNADALYMYKNHYEDGEEIYLDDTTD